MNELTLRLTSTDQGMYLSEVLRSPFRDLPSHRFGPPLHASELQRLAALTDSQIAALAHQRTPPAPPEALSPESLGTRLFESALGGDVGDHYRRCCSSGGDLRLRLLFAPGDPQSELLAALPWELLFDPQTHTHLARQRTSPVVRDVALAQRLQPLDVELPLRILVVDAAPRGMHALDLKAEKRRMQEALAPLVAKGLAEATYASTLRQMRQKILDRRIHVLHYMGHGGYLGDEGLGALYFETGDGELDQVDGDLFGEFVAGAPDLRLVVLNACNTARYSGAAGRPLHYGVATGVLQRTGRSVLAMQRPISDRAAISFSETFYGYLARNHPVDVATAEARLQLAHDGPEWSTPVLFLSAEDGRIFEVADAPPKPGRAVAPAGKRKKAAAPPTRLGIRSMAVAPGEEDQGRFIPHLTDDHLDLRQHFHLRYIREDRLWLEAVLPELRSFLQLHTAPGHRVDLVFAAHATVAFAAGWVLDAKSGLEVAISQPTSETGTNTWSADDGTALAGDQPLWERRPDVLLDGTLPDVALALGISREVVDEVRAFIAAKGLPIGRIVDAVPAGGPGFRSVAGGAHALQLALALSHRARERQPHERSGRLHVFAATPNALPFHLGRLSRAWGGITLYEYAFGATESYARYRASMLLPPPGAAEPPADW